MKFLTKFASIFLFVLSLVFSAYSQDFEFSPITFDERLDGADLIANNITSNGINYEFSYTPSYWIDMVNDPNWGNRIKIKSSNTIVTFGVNHEYLTYTGSNYSLKLVYEIRGYSNPNQPNNYVTIYDTLTIHHSADSLAKYQDVSFKKYANFHKVVLKLHKLFDATNTNFPAVEITNSSYPNLNFFIKIYCATQIYNKVGKNNNNNPVTIYGANSPLLQVVKGTVNNNVLPLTWNFPNVNELNSIKPGKFELEWTYVDNYRVNPSSNFNVTELPISQCNYFFKNNATRISLDTNYFELPLVYNKGYLVYRVRFVKPDSTNYQIPIYTNWSVSSESGTVSSLSNNNYYKIANAFTNDSLPWEYTISFAEKGKYKHVIGFYDGLLKNRQSITRFNSNPNDLIATEQIFDYEGRPAISILPTPIRTSNFTYQPNLSSNSVTSKAYKAEDFDRIAASCYDEIFLSPLADSSLANKYYSSSNQNKNSYNAYIPDAGGYPLVHTLLAPGYEDKVIKQGGAGDSLQLFYGHYQKNIYLDAEQSSLNKVFGINIGNASFYRHNIIRDPNGQLSVSYVDYKGNTVFTSLIGIPDTLKHPIIKNENANEQNTFSDNILSRSAQRYVSDRILFDYRFYNEVAGNNKLLYKVTINPYPTICPNLYLTTDLAYKYSLLSECGDEVIANQKNVTTSGVISANSPITDSSGGVMFLNASQYYVSKDLRIDMDKLPTIVDSFMTLAEMQACLKSEDWFVRNSVLNQTFPCDEIIQSESDCATKKKQMLEELWPNRDSIYTKRKYGYYSIEPSSGAIHSNNNSIFTRNEGSYSYQDSCIHLPDTVYKNGKVYTNLALLPVDTFISIFNSQIAESLLPLHPEYCSLLKCYDDTYPAFLSSIANGTEAQKIGYLSLEEMILKDSLYQLMLQYPILYPSPLDTLLHLTSNTGLVSIDSLAIQVAYCSNSDAVVYKTCLLETFQSEIRDFIYATPQARELYFKQARALYLGNRTKYLPLFKGFDTCNTICSGVRLELVEPSLFEISDSATFMRELAQFDSSAYNSFQSYFNLQNPVNDSLLALAFDSAVYLYNNQMSSLALGVINNIALQLSSCADSSILARLADTLETMYRTGRIQNGVFSPGDISYAIQANGLTLSELCNPYLVSSGSFFESRLSDGIYSCNSNNFYQGAFETFSTALKAAIDNNTSGFISHNLNVANSFDAALVSQVSSSSISVYTTKNSSRIRLTVVGSDTVNFYISRMDSSLNADPIFGQNSYTIESIQCINDLFNGFYAQSFNGAIGKQIMVMTVMSNSTRYFYFIWNDKIEINQNVADNALINAVTCATFKDHFTDFVSVLNTYGVNYTDGPNFSRMLAGFMNYQLGVSFDVSDYENFISSCALTDSLLLAKKYNFAQIIFSDSVAYNNFQQAFNNLHPNYVFDPYINIKSGASITSYFDISYIDPYLYRQYQSFLSTQTNGVVNFHNWLVPAASNRVGYLYTKVPVDLNSILPTSLQSKFQLVSLGTDYLSYMQHNNFDSYNKLELASIGTVSVLEQTRANWLLEKYINENNPTAIWLATYHSFWDEQHDVPEKQDYLNYTYSQSGINAYSILDSISARNIKSQIAFFNNQKLRYGSAHRPDLVNNLYYRNEAPVVASTIVNYIFSEVSAYLGGGQLFPTQNATTIINQGLERLDVFRTSDGMYWYRYFDSDNKLYNIYVRTPKYIDKNNISKFVYNNHAINVGEESIRSFTLSVLDSSFANPMQRDLLAYTDFKLSESNVLYDVLLASPVNLPMPVADTGNNCERSLLYIAIDNGKQAYRTYLDSIKSFMLADAKDYFMNRGGIEESLWLSYGSHKFNYTLYKYDRAGNLTATVPPAGVRTLPNDSLTVVNTIRDSIQYRASLTPNHEKVSSYRYNSLNAVTEQITPDGGRTLFFYDNAGRLVYSQNAVQRQTMRVSYSMYDPLSRIVESGQLKLNCDTFFDPYPQVPNVPLLSCASLTLDGYVSPLPSMITNLITKTNEQITNDILSYPREEVVVTVYDTAFDTVMASYPGLDKQTHLRNRVASVVYYPSLGIGANRTRDFEYAMHYSYDIMGNVKTLVREFPKLSVMHQQYKRIDYDYDLISGKVNLVSYNKSYGDQYFQKYLYDADNRITKVTSSTDGLLWENDAKYEYYAHGPLARVVLGAYKVQGVDYIYTIQGWLKAINGDKLDTLKDPSLDNYNTNTINRDVVGISLDYFNGDYKPIGGGASAAVNNLSGVTKSLYNGNIVRMQSNVAAFTPLSAAYAYDQLNRLMKADYEYYSNLDSVVNPTSDYQTRYAYDPDGNLKSLVRYGHLATSPLMDSLVYRYQLNSMGNPGNKLMHVADFAANNYDNDIKYNNNIAATSYQYDAIGNLVSDYSNGIANIKWNLQNKVQSTYNNLNNTALKFQYDGMGQRYLKLEEKNTASNNADSLQNNNTYYVRDAQGNILAVYEYSMNNKWKYEEIAKTIIRTGREIMGAGPSTNQRLFRELVMPTSQHNGVFISNYVAGLFNGYSGFIQPIIDSMPVSYYVQTNNALRENIIMNALDQHQFYSLITNYSQAHGTSLMATALMAQLRNQSLEELTDIFYTVEHNYPHLLPTFVSFMQATPEITKEVLSFYGVPLADIDKWLDTLQYSQVSFGNELANALQHKTIEVAKTYFQTVYDNGALDILPYWQAMEQHPDFLMSNDYLFAAPSAGGFPTNWNNFFLKALISYTHSDTLGAYLDSHEYGRTVLDATSTKELLLYTILNDTAVSIPLVYARQMDEFDDTLVVRASAATYATIGTAPVINLLNSYGYTYATVIDSILKMVASEQEIHLSEHHLYGSSRLGIKKYLPKQVYAYWNATAPLPIIDTAVLLSRKPWYSLEMNDIIDGLSTVAQGGSIDRSHFASNRVIGQKQYELTNHLGNVMATVSDLPYKYVGDNDSIRSHAALAAVYDYYPFGSLKPGRYLSDTSANCVTINQSVFVEKERDSLVWQPGSPSIFMPKVLNPSLYVGQKVAATLTSDGYKLEIADTSTGGSAVALTSTIAVTPQVPQEISFGLSIQTGTFVLQAVEVINGTEYLLGSVTQSAGSVSTDGGTEQIQELVLNILPSSSSVQLQLWSPLIGTVGGVGGPVVVTPGAGGTIGVLGPSTGNVGICCITIGYGKWIRVKKKYLEQQNITVTLCDSLEDRYRFGWNAHEKVNEIAGIGNHTTAQFGEFDTRLGRRWNTDPKSGLMPNESPYAINHGNPIAYKDPKGDFGFIGAAIGAGIGGLASLTTSVISDGWGSLKDGKTWAKAGVNATAGAIVGATGGLGAGLVATATTSFGVSLAEDAIDGKELNIKKAIASSVTNTVLFGAGKFGADKLSKAVTKHWWRRGNTNAFMRHLGKAPGTNVGQVIDRASDVIGVGLGLSMDDFFPDKEQMPTIEHEVIRIYAEKNEEGNYEASPDSIENASQEMQQQQQRAVEEYNKSQDSSGNKE